MSFVALIVKIENWREPPPWLGFRVPASKLRETKDCNVETHVCEYIQARVPLEKEDCAEYEGCCLLCGAYRKLTQRYACVGGFVLFEIRLGRAKSALRWCWCSEHRWNGVYKPSYSSHSSPIHTAIHLSCSKMTFHHRMTSFPLVLRTKKTASWFNMTSFYRASLASKRATIPCDESRFSCRKSGI